MLILLMTPIYVRVGYVCNKQQQQQQKQKQKRFFSILHSNLIIIAKIR